MPTDVEVVAVDPDTGAQVWVPLGSWQARVWAAGVIETDGRIEHLRFVQVDRPVEDRPVDLTAAPWLKMYALHEFPSCPTRAEQARKDQEIAKDGRRWRLLDRSTGRCSRQYTWQELWDRLQARKRSTLQRKDVLDDVTGRQWRAVVAYEHPGWLERALATRPDNS